MWQVPATEMVEALPHGWADEPHERVLWIILFLIISYLGKHKWDRRSYTKSLKEAAKHLSNPHSDREINGKTNSAQLLNYVIEDVRAQQERVLDRLSQTADKKDIERLDGDIRDLRKRIEVVAHMEGNR